MKIAMIGLGRMGANMSRRLLRDGHQVVGYDRDEGSARILEKKGLDEWKVGLGRASALLRAFDGFRLVRVVVPPARHVPRLRLRLVPGVLERQEEAARHSGRLDVPTVPASSMEAHRGRPARSLDPLLLGPLPRGHRRHF